MSLTRQKIAFPIDIAHCQDTHTGRADNVSAVKGPLCQDLISISLSSTILPLLRIGCLFMFCMELSYSFSKKCLLALTLYSLSEIHFLRPCNFFQSPLSSLLMSRYHPSAGQIGGKEIAAVHRKEQRDCEDHVC